MAENNTYIDGGVRINTPVSVLKNMGADKVIAITFVDDKKFSLGIKNVTGIDKDAFRLMLNSKDKEEINMADVNVRLNVKNVHIFDTSKAYYLICKGYNLIENNIHKIKAILEINNM